MPNDLPQEDTDTQPDLRGTLPNFADHREQVLERLRNTPGVHLPADAADAEPKAPNDQSTRDFQAETDRQVSEGSDVLRNTEGLREDRWSTLDVTDRLGVLSDVEARMANMQGRPPVPVTMESMAPAEYGGYSSDQRQITLNENHLSGDTMPATEFADTIVHEGRHAYQDYAVQHPGFVSDQKTVDAWADNQSHYRDMQTYGADRYREQPLEKDAWEYAERVVKPIAN